MTAQDLKNAEDLIRSYNTNYNSNQKFRALFDYYLQRPNLAAFRGKSLREYVKIISSFSISSIYRSYSQKKPTPGNVKELLGKFYSSQEFIRLQQASSAKQPAEVRGAEETQLGKGAKKKEGVSKTGVSGKGDAQEPKPQKGTKKIELPEAESIQTFLKNIFSKAQIATRSVADQTTSGLKSFLGRSLSSQASQLGGRALNTGARLAGRSGLSALNGLNKLGMGLMRGLVVSGPWGWVILGVILIILVLFPIILMLFKTNSILGLPDGSIVSTGPGGPGSTSSKLEISKTTGNNAVDNPDPTDPSKGVINYTIKVIYKYLGTAKIEVSDTIPSNTEFVEASENPTREVSLVKWLIDGISTNQSREFSLKLRATKPDTIVENTAQAKIISVTTPTPNPSGSTPLLPNPLPDPIANWSGVKNDITNIINRYPQNLETYKQSSAATGVHWQILAAKHYREGGADPNNSLVSGRRIGQNEPDVVNAKACKNPDQARLGDAVWLSSGVCGFKTILDSAIYAGNHLRVKLGGNLPNNFEEVVTALSRYNGGGNRNCGQSPYTGCPRRFEGEDDSYVMNLFDQRHQPMYIIYCADFQKCNPPRVDQRPGTITVIRALGE